MTIHGETVLYDYKYLYEHSLGSLNITSIREYKSDRLTGVLPAIKDQMNLLVVTVKSLMHFNQNLELLFDYIWIVVPNKEIQQVYSMLMVATSSKLDPTFRIVGELDALYEKKQQQYHGWHVQQDIKLAMSRFVRTTYYITLDADVFCGRKLHYNDFIDSNSNKAYTRSERAKTFYAYTSGNFNLTGLHLKISHPPVDDKTLMIGFTPIIFNTAVVNNMTNYFTMRERRPWLEYFMELHVTNKIFTEYLVYWMWSVDNGVYDKYHINVPSSHLVLSTSPTVGSFSSCFMAQTRPPFIQVDDNVINATVDVWTAFKNGMKDAASKKTVSVSH
eukprot:gene30892-41110_t